MAKTASSWYRTWPVSNNLFHGTRFLGETSEFPLFHGTQFRGETLYYLCIMTRKRWTPQTEVTDALLRLREKRKWQLAYRRYVVEQKPSETYGPFFGLDIQSLRQWFSLQFKDGQSWETYGQNWQFEHIIPAAYFDFGIDADLKLCWSFVNMRVQHLEPGNHAPIPFNLLAARPYFQQLLERTGWESCQDMLVRIDELAADTALVSEAGVQFILGQKARLEQIASLDAAELQQLNQGTSLDSLLLEREILKKFS